MKRYLAFSLVLALALTALVLTAASQGSAGQAAAMSRARSPVPPVPPAAPAAIPPLPQPIVYVSADPANPANWDIVYMSTDGVTTNLSLQVDAISPTLGNPLFFGATIDNHPALSPAGDQIVLASDRLDGANVDLWLLDIVTSTAGVTVTGVTRLTSGPEPERHPHFSEDGRSIIFDAKRKCGPLKPSQCSQPAVPECDYPGAPAPDDGNLYEGIYIFSLDTMTESLLIDPTVADPSWPDNSNEGHASLSSDGSRIIFGADRGQGDDGWEVFSAGYLSASHTLTGLQQLTETPGKAMSGGGVLAHAGDGVFFNSTATKNSQLYRIPLNPDPLFWLDWEPVTNNCANDYVPEHLGEDALLFTRQIYPDPSNPDLYDLDVWAKELDSGVESNLTSDAVNDQTLLLGDEVVCFCGGPPNTSGCYLPRVWTLCSVRQMRLIVEERYEGPIEIPPDYAQRLTDYWNYLLDWANRYLFDPEHPELGHRAQYILMVLQLTADSQWDPAWCDIKVVLPGFMPPRAPEIIQTEIVALSLTSGQSTSVRVEADDKYCDGCLDLVFSATGGSFAQDTFLDQRPVISDWTTLLTTTWTAPAVTLTSTFSLTVRITDTTGLTATTTITATVAPTYDIYYIYLPLVLKQGS